MHRANLRQWRRPTNRHIQQYSSYQPVTSMVSFNDPPARLQYRSSKQSVNNTSCARPTFCVGFGAKPAYCKLTVGNLQGCHYITRCNTDFTLQLHLACDIDIYIAIVLHVAMSHDVATFLLTWASYRLVLELQRVRRARQAAWTSLQPTSLSFDYCSWFSGAA